MTTYVSFTEIDGRSKNPIDLTEQCIFLSHCLSQRSVFAALSWVRVYWLGFWPFGFYVGDFGEVRENNLTAASGTFDSFDKLKNLVDLVTFALNFSNLDNILILSFI